MNGSYLTAADLYSLVREYDQNVSTIDLAYGNGFDKKGKSYFSYLCQNYPEFKNWILANHPEAATYF